jgi:phosphoglycerol transferase MdoB-like AlkP superfamily enzyme
MGMGSFFQSKGYEVIEGRQIGLATDEAMMKWIVNDLIPKLLLQQRPFALVFLNDGTHPIGTIRIGDTKYIRELRELGYPDTFLAFTWFDENLHEFLGGLEKLGLRNNTELVLAGDHLIMHGYGGLTGKYVDRNLTMIFAWRKQDELWRRGQEKVLSLYDLAPTILDLLGIEYSPHFPLCEWKKHFPIMFN